MAQYKDLPDRLNALDKDGREFAKVEIYRQPTSARLGQHHLLIYWYPVVQDVHAGLQIDWGQNGLSFNDVYVPPEGRVVVSKECGVCPMTLVEQYREIEEREYSLVSWNCQHFSQHLYDQASGNWRLNAELGELERSEAEFSTVCVYERPADAEPLSAWPMPTSSRASSSGANGSDSATVVGLVYWYNVDVDAEAARRKSPRSDGDSLFVETMSDAVPTELQSTVGEPRGVVLEWATEGLAFCKLDVDAGTARECGIGRHNYKNSQMTEAKESRGGSVRCRFVDAAPGQVVRTRRCGLAPGRLLVHLRDVEGRAFQAGTWNCRQFATHMFERVPPKGRSPELQQRLQELDHLGAELDGLREALVPGAVADRSDRFVLIYRYSHGECQAHLLLDFGPEGLAFEESEEELRLKTVRTKAPLKRVRKPTLFPRMKPSELQRLVNREIELKAPAPLDDGPLRVRSTGSSATSGWSLEQAQKAHTRLFANMPGMDCWAEGFAGSDARPAPESDSDEGSGAAPARASSIEQGGPGGAGTCRETSFV